MCEAAIAGDDRFGVSRADADREGPAYTVDLLRSLSGPDELTFIVGGDMAHSLPAWRDPEGVLALARFGVAEREGVRRADIAERLAGLAGADERVVFFDMPRLDISSSLIRRRAAAGAPLRYLVPDAVAHYIEREGLYRQAPAYP
jgi:nicotinate-nucleotide adenylyltransferase